MRKTDTKKEKSGNDGIEQDTTKAPAADLVVNDTDQEQETDQDTDQEVHANSFEQLQPGDTVIYCDSFGVDHKATITGKHEGQRLDLVVHHPDLPYDLGTVVPAASADQKEAWYFITE